MKKKLLMMGISGLSFLFSTKMSAQIPNADFTISQPTTCVGSVIQITDISSDTPTAWTYTVENMTGTLTVQNPTLSFNASGDFDITLIATNAAGSSTPVTKNVIVNDLPVITVGQATAVCAGDNATLTASGATTYTWSNGTSNNAGFVPTATSDYTVEGTDANSCKNTAVQSVSVNATPTLVLTGNNDVCLNSAITQTVSGADTYSWSTGISGDNISESPIVNTTYSVTGTYTLTGCSSIMSKMITVNSLPTVTVNDATVCAGSVFTINASGASTYVYSTGSNTVIPTVNASYTVDGVSAQGCNSAASAVLNVTVNALPVIAVTGGTVCAGSPFVLAPNGVATYTVLNSASGATVTPLANTSYSVIGQDGNGCTTAAAAVADVTVNALPVVAVNSGAICSGDVFTFSLSGASTYTVVDGLNVISTNTVAPSANISYSVVGVDAAGCLSSSFAVANVTVNALPVVSVNSGSICNGSSFTITANGAATYAYQGGSNVVNPTANATYSVAGTDVNGCVSSAVVSTVTVAAPVVVAVTGATTICSGNSTTLTASGASSYGWVNPIVLTNSIAVNPSATTVYTVIGLTGNCTGMAVVSVSVNATPTVVASVITSTICSGSTTSLTSTGAAAYSWNSGETTAVIVITPTTNVTYTVTGTTNGCSNKVTITQNVDACLGIAQQTNNFETSLYPNPNKGSFTVKVTEPTTVKIINIIGQTVYTSELTEGENAVSINDQVTGIYFVQLKQGNQVKTVRIVKN